MRTKLVCCLWCPFVLRSMMVHVIRRSFIVSCRMWACCSRSWLACCFFWFNLIIVTCCECMYLLFHVYCVFIGCLLFVCPWGFPEGMGGVMSPHPPQPNMLRLLIVWVVKHRSAHDASYLGCRLSMTACMFQEQPCSCKVFSVVVCRTMVILSG